MKPTLHNQAYLRELLARAGLTQRGAARLLGISERAMRNYVGGVRKVPYAVQFWLEWCAGDRREEKTK